MVNRVLTIRTILDYIGEYFPSLLFWDGYHKHEIRQPKRFYKHRSGMPNEIRIEFDSEDKNGNWESINQTAINLWKAGYSFAVFSVEGGRSPHIHIYDCDELENWSKESRTNYRKKFLKKYCPKDSNPDIDLCDEKHLCALEFANHFKYHKPKLLLSFFDNGTLSNQGMDLEIWKEMTFGKKKPIKLQKLLKRNVSKKFGDILKETQRDLIITNLTFEQVFDKYNIKYKGRMALCPFHADKDNSLSFTNKNGLWKCWGAGCGTKGDIITMVKMLEEKKRNDNEKRS